MPRALLAALPLLAGLLPLTAAALGLGEIRLQSALNEPLRAEIQVRADSPDEIRQLDVSLASPETFARFGLDRPAFLNDLRFQLERDGIRGVVRISSTQPVAEPFVSLLLDVSWPTGRLLREYTVLLDPPAFVQETAPRVSQPAVAPATQPAQTIQRPAEPVAASAAEPAAGAASAPARRPVPVAGDEYQVRSNDTLWGVAERLRPSSVSHNQMMVALYRTNPEAFAGNINRLLAGAVLRVPGEGEISALSGREANAEVARQNQEWQAGRADPTPRLQLVPPTTGTATAAPAVETAPAGPAPAEPAPAERAAAVTPGADPAAVAGLQAELEESRRLLSIRDDQLRALQEQLTALQTGSAEPPAPGAEVPATEVPPLEEAVEDEVALTEIAPAPAPPVEVREPAPAAAAVREAPSSGGSLFDTISALVFNVWFLASAAVILLAGLFVVFSRRRMAAEVEETGRFTRDLRGGMAPAAGPLSRDDFIVEESPHERSQSLTSEPMVAMPGRAGDDGETPLERTISTDSGVEVDQADVIAEADFHMAYGLYDQAAALLGRALEDNPGRRDLRLKLLEVFFIWENKGAFLREAQAFRDQVSGTGDPEWNKVLIMGKQICPDEGLFAEAARAPAEDNLDLTLAGEASGIVDIALDGDGDMDPTTIAPPHSTDLLDFDLGDDVAGDDTGLQKTEVALDVPDIDSHAPTMETPTIESPGFDSPTMETPTIESQGPDFGDAGAATMETPTIETPIGGTLESPTLENAAPGMAGLLGDEGPDQTEEINLEDLGLDLTGLDQAAGELGTTGVHDILDDAADRSGSFDLTEDPSVIEGMEVDATAEMRGVSLDEGTQDQPAYSGASGDARSSADTAEHPVIGDPGIGERMVEDTAEQPFLGGETIDEPIDLGELDFDHGEDAQTAIESTAARSGVRRGPDGPTMTEVGTKLDLARAYVDMGDPDGARSILNEVLEEGDTAQRQQARQLLDDLAD